MNLAAFTLDFTLFAHRNINFIDRFMDNTYGCSTKNTASTISELSRPVGAENKIVSKFHVIKVNLIAFY